MNTPVANILIKMVAESKGNLHDIEHFLKVYAYAKAIGEKELDDALSLAVLETAAILHDIACPLCREKYGHAEGKLQELEGGPMTKAFLKEFDLPDGFTERVVWLVSHHHSYAHIESMEHRILLEADFLVNAAESGYSKQQILSARESFFCTDTGTSLLNSIFLIQE